MGKVIKIMVADDQHLFRQGLIELLNKAPALKVIGEAENGKELLSIMKREIPDVVLLDIEMPVMDGNEAFKKIKMFFPNVKVLIVSNYNEEYYKADFMIKGANGLLLKDEKIQVLLTAINAVYRGSFFYNQTVYEIVTASLLKSAHKFFERLNLSLVEIEIIRHICKERDSPEIASILCLSVDTIKFHRKKIFRKTKIKNLAGLVKFAHKNNISKVE